MSLWNRFATLAPEDDEEEIEIGCIDHFLTGTGDFHCGLSQPLAFNCPPCGQCLSQNECGLDSLDVEVPNVGVNAVQRKTGKMKSAGKGKITIDSGAGESVLPKDMLPNEELIEGEAKKNGVKYVAANGSKMENYGEKKVRFKHGADEVLNSITFQATEVKKPLAAVSKILDKGNVVVSSRKGSYILNEKTGKKIELKEERGTFVMEVEFFEPEVTTEGFPRPGSK